MEAKKEGYEGEIIFIIQCEDACLFPPNEELDPQYSYTLWRVAETGIKIYAYSSKVKTDEISLGEGVGISSKIN